MGGVDVEGNGNVDGNVDVDVDGWVARWMNECLVSTLVSVVASMSLPHASCRGYDDRAEAGRGMRYGFSFSALGIAVHWWVTSW